MNRCFRSARSKARDLRTPSWLWISLVLVGCIGCAAPAGPRRAATVSVYYATTRQVVENPGSPDAAFGSRASNPQIVRYGRATVEIQPRSTRIVSYDPPLAGNPGLLPGRFNTEVRSQIGVAHPLIVYVHGFNNTFSTAVHRAAIFSHELQPEVAERPAIYSWPSASKLFAYAKDEESALLNQDNIRRFLTGLHRGDATTPIVLIGHSMGARAITYGLRDIFLSRAGGGGLHPIPRQPMFSHLVLLEADVNRLYFSQNLLRASALCGHITVYASKRDLALDASTFVHGGYKRLGGQEEGFSSGEIAKKIDIIDASAVRSDIFGHSYDRPVLFEDLRAVIRGKNLSERENHTLERDPASGLYRLLREPRV